MDLVLEFNSELDKFQLTAVHIDFINETICTYLFITHIFITCTVIYIKNFKIKYIYLHTSFLNTHTHIHNILLQIARILSEQEQTMMSCLVKRGEWSTCVCWMRFFVSCPTEFLVNKNSEWEWCSFPLLALAQPILNILFPLLSIRKIRKVLLLELLILCFYVHVFFLL